MPFILQYVPFFSHERGELVGRQASKGETLLTLAGFKPAPFLSGLKRENL